MTVPRKYDPTQKDQVFNTLRREILAARLKLVLDKKLGEQTSETVKRLAGMTLPPRAAPALGSGVTVLGPAFSRQPHVDVQIDFVEPQETASQEARYKW